MTTTTAFDTAQGQVIYHQQRQAGGNTYENVDILRVHPHQLHDVHFVHPMVGAEVPGGVGAGGKPGGELAYYTTTLPHHHHPQSQGHPGSRPGREQRIYGTTTRATSEPRVKKNSVPVGSTGHLQQAAPVDRYSMPGRSKSADRIPMRMRRPSEHPHHHHQGGGHGHPGKSVSIASPPDQWGHHHHPGAGQPDPHQLYRY